VRLSEDGSGAVGLAAAGAVRLACGGAARSPENRPKYENASAAIAISAEITAVLVFFLIVSSNYTAFAAVCKYIFGLPKEVHHHKKTYCNI
jgi:hypothetical protein